MPAAGPGAPTRGSGSAGRDLGREIASWLREPLVRGIVVWMVVVSVGGQTIGGAYLPTYFIERHGVAVASLSLYTGAPPLAQVVVSLGAGLACDLMVSKAGLPSLLVQARWVAGSPLYLPCISPVGGGR